MKIYMNIKIKAGKKYSKMIKVTALGFQVMGDFLYFFSKPFVILLYLIFKEFLPKKKM